MQITAAVARERKGDFRIETLDLEEPRDDEVLVRIEAVGLCHTDLGFRDIDTELTLPAVLGHEGAGIVERVGGAVSKVRPGDKVLLTFRSCGACDHCAGQHSAYCRRFPELNFAGRRSDGSKALRAGIEPVSSHFFGQSSFATHALAYERNLVRVDPALDSATYAPLGCGVQTGAGAIMRSLACEPGSSLLVIGGGTVGLSAAMAGVIRRCAHIIVIEPKAERRAMALELGATHAIDPAAGDVIAQVRAIVPQGTEYALDTSGIVPAIQAAMGCLGARGVIGLVGSPASLDAVVPLPLVAAITFGFTIKGIIEGDSEPDSFIPELIDLHRQGLFPFDRLIRTYDLEDINQAVHDQHDGRCVKAVLLTRGEYGE
jgi:aryl-alcohol dehydrogenase